MGLLQYPASRLSWCSRGQYCGVVNAFPIRGTRDPDSPTPETHDQRGRCRATLGRRGFYIETVNVAQIDEALQRYSAAEGRIAANLHELENLSTYQILTTDTLKGQTGAELGPALRSAGELWSVFSLFRDALASARKLRGTGNRVGGGEREQLGELLTKPTIVLSTSQTPLHERDLLDDGHNSTKVSMEELLSRMRKLYMPIRDGVAKVDERLRSVLPRLDSAAMTLTQLEADAESLGIVEPELRRARDHMDRVRRLSVDDPLALDPTAGSELDRMVSTAAGRLAQSRQGHDRLQSDRASIPALVAEIRTLRARADAAWADAQAKVVGAHGLVRVPNAQAIDGPRGLAERAASINDPAVADASWQVQREMLDQWLKQTRRLHDQLTRAEQANRAPLTRRDELRGLLTAYRAKMAGQGRAEERVLGDLVDEAHNELFTAPTDLVRAEQLVRDLANALVSNSHRAPGGSS